MRSDQRERLAMARVAMTSTPEQLLAGDAGMSAGGMNMRGTSGTSVGSSSTPKPTQPRTQPAARPAREFKLQDLTMLSITPVIHGIQLWWLERAERHYLICAEVELQRAREANMNVAYYQKRAALARTAARDVMLA